MLHLATAEGCPGLRAPFPPVFPCAAVTLPSECAYALIGVGWDLAEEGEIRAPLESLPSSSELSLGPSLSSVGTHRTPQPPAAPQLFHFFMGYLVSTYLVGFSSHGIRNSQKIRAVRKTVKHMRSWRKSIPGRGSSKGEGPWRHWEKAGTG